MGHSGVGSGGHFMCYALLGTWEATDLALWAWAATTTAVTAMLVCRSGHRTTSLWGKTPADSYLHFKGNEDVAGLTLRRCVYLHVCVWVSECKWLSLCVSVCMYKMNVSVYVCEWVSVRWLSLCLSVFMYKMNVSMWEYVCVSGRENLNVEEKLWNAVFADPLQAFLSHSLWDLFLFSLFLLLLHFV